MAGCSKKVSKNSRPQRERVAKLAINVVRKTDKQSGGSVRAAQIPIRYSSCTRLGQLSLPCTLFALANGMNRVCLLELTSICTLMLR
jgi:hypothetical protein